MLDVAAQGEKALVAEGDVVFHVERRHPLVEGSHHHCRYLDIGKDIHRHPRECGDAQNSNYQRADYYGVRITQ
jgi:hypothetical protein